MRDSISPVVDYNMAIPDFQTIMLPLLKLTADQNEHQFRDIVETLAQEFELSQEERRVLLPSRTSFLFDNRVGWARLYLVRAGLLEKRERGFVKITQRGLQLLMQTPAKIDRKFLEQYPEFIEFVKPPIRGKAASTIAKAKEIDEQTPEEAFEYGYEQMRHELAQQLLTQVINTSPKFFERLVIDLLVKMGYGGSIKDAGKVVGASGDEGIDGVIKEDRLGLDTIYVQAKRWQGTIGRPELMKFVGALKGQKANKGVFITTSKFSNDAMDYVSKIDSKVVLIDGEQLAEYMIDFHIGVSPVATYEIQRLDSDYFVED
jgi:restriction system protein